MFTIDTAPPQRPEILQCIWEIKPTFIPGSGFDPTTEGVQKDIITFQSESHDVQLLQQAKSAFCEFPNQQKLHIFLALGLWIRHFIALRSNMPDWGDLDRPSPEDRFDSYLTEASAWFPLINEAGDYHLSFRKFWKKAANDAYEQLSGIAAE